MASFNNNRRPGPRSLSPAEEHIARKMIENLEHMRTKIKFGNAVLQSKLQNAIRIAQGLSSYDVLAPYRKK